MHAFAAAAQNAICASMPKTHSNAIHPNASAKINVARVSVLHLPQPFAHFSLLRPRRVRMRARRAIATLEKQNLTTA